MRPGGNKIFPGRCSRREAPSRCSPARPRENSVGAGRDGGRSVGGVRVYPDREAAGRALAQYLLGFRAAKPLVLGLPRGGVPVAAAVREVIGGELDVVLVRKLGVPGQSELAAGAIAEDGIRLDNPDVCRHTGLDAAGLARIESQERAELERRRARWRPGAPPAAWRGTTALLIDDGMATGASMAVACRVARLRQVRYLVVAVPVASPEAVRRLESEADEVICPWVPSALGGVGGAYRDFHQLTDAEVARLLTARQPGKDRRATERYPR